MALTRKFLGALGIDDDKVDEIINAHTETVNGLKEEIDKYKADAEKLPAVQKELNTAKEAMANGDKSPYKVKYEALVEENEKLQQQFDNFKADVDAKELLAKKTDAYRHLLKDTGVSEKRIESILKVSDIESVELDKEGKIKDVDNLKNYLEKEWADFIVKTTEQGASVSNPPQTTGGGKVWTKEEILKIKDTTERQKAWGEFLIQERNK